ncbi:MAG: hypothetical protein II776_01195, partial [Clostridia bacterium]|nr:hypothetical protein [Clostridia bacterium]
MARIMTKLAAAKEIGAVNPCSFLNINTPDSFALPENVRDYRGKKFVCQHHSQKFHLLSYFSSFFEKSVKMAGPVDFSAGFYHLLYVVSYALFGRIIRGQTIFCSKKIHKSRERFRSRSAGFPKNGRIERKSGRKHRVFSRDRKQKLWNRILFQRNDGHAAV